MDNKISFTGYKNVGVFQVLMTDARKNPLVVNTNLLVQLTDDFNGKDLEKFYQITKKCKPHVNIPRFNLDKNFVYISSANSYQEGVGSQIFVNGKEIPSKDETLPLFTYLANLTKRIVASAKKKEIVVNNDFKYGEEGRLYLCTNDEVAKNISDEVLETMYDQNNTGQGAEIINDTIAARMEDYFA